MEAILNRKELRHECREVVIDNRRYNINTYFLGPASASDKNPVSFSPGFATKTGLYRKFLEQIYALMETKAFIVIPEIIGHRIDSVDGKEPYENSSYDACNKVYGRLMEQLGIDARKRVAHSSGPFLEDKLDQPDKVALINPLMPVKYSRMGYMMRGMFSFSFLYDSFYTMSSGFSRSYTGSFFRNLKNNLDCIEDFTELSMDMIYHDLDKTDICLIYYANHAGDDRFFRHSPGELAARCRRLVPVKLGGAHNSIFYNPGPAAGSISKFFRL